MIEPKGGHELLLRLSFFFFLSFFPFSNEVVSCDDRDTAQLDSHVERFCRLTDSVTSPKEVRSTSLCWSWR